MLAALLWQRSSTAKRPLQESVGLLQGFTKRWFNAAESTPYNKLTIGKDICYKNYIKPECGLDIREFSRTLRDLKVLR